MGGAVSYERGTPVVRCVAPPPPYPEVFTNGLFRLSYGLFGLSYGLLFGLSHGLFGSLSIQLIWIFRGISAWSAVWIRKPSRQAGLITYPYMLHCMRGGVECQGRSISPCL